uniref:Ig-like domain-containing protein n=1 Tax=Naja naja TaxID=35670 RepID=A0A8C6XRY9_NAJNA
MVKPGSQFNLICKVTGFSIGNSLYDWHWISQPPGKGLRWLSVEVNNGGVFSDIQLVESGPGMVRPGSQLNLVCKVTGFSIATSSAAWHWVRQSPGKGLEWISAIHPSSRGKWYGNSVKGHATISADQTRNEFSLQLNSVTAADSSVYFCAQDYTMRQDLFGLCKKMEFVFTKCNAK